jgi:hypothetical protein
VRSSPAQTPSPILSSQTETTPLPRTHTHTPLLLTTAYLGHPSTPSLLSFFISRLPARVLRPRIEVQTQILKESPPLRISEAQQCCSDFWICTDILSRPRQPRPYCILQNWRSRSPHQVPPRLSQTTVRRDIALSTETSGFHPRSTTLTPGRLDAQDPPRVLARSVETSTIRCCPRLSGPSLGASPNIAPLGTRLRSEGVSEA